MAKQKQKTTRTRLTDKIKALFGKKSKGSKAQNKKTGIFSRLKSKVMSFAKKYIPSLMILFSGGTAAQAAPDFQPTGGPRVNSTTLLQMKNMQKTFKFNDLTLDLNTMRPEEVSMIFMSNHKFNAVYAPKGKAATIENATGYGPLLTRMNVLKNFIQANPKKYAALNQAIQKAGINSIAFEKAWMSYMTPEQQQELIEDLMQYTWRSSYQPVFNKLAAKGYPKITFDNYTNAENFGYTAAVISCLGQSSRQTVDIFAKAKERADAALGDKATLGDYIDASYDIRHERWGLDTRYFGKDGQSGEKALNKKIRESLRRKSSILMDAKEFEEFSKKFDNGLILTGDAIKTPYEDSLFLANLKVQKNIPLEDSLTLQNKKESQSDAEQMPKSDLLVDDFWGMQDLLLSKNLLNLETDDLQAYRDDLSTKLNDLRAQLNDISSDVYTIMGRKINMDYGNMKPESVGHVYESALDPTMKDAANSALGLYQFNLNNTMKLLADDFADEFPELQKAKKDYGVKSAQYASVWRKYSTGSTKDRFEQRQLEFMWRIAYQPAFDKMTKSCKLPKITLDNYNNKEYRVYTAAMMSLVNQSPRKSTKFMEQAYNRVARGLTGGKKPDPNQVGLVSYDVRDEAWGRKNRSLHRRYKGGNGVIGEQEMCMNMLKYGEKAPALIAQISDMEKTLSAVDFALNNPNQFKNVLENPMADNTDVAVTDAIRDQMDKVVAIQKHAHNIKELRMLRQRVRHNLSKVISGETVRVGQKSAYVHKKGGNNGSRRA